MSDAAVVVHRDAPLLARAGAARLVTALVDAQAARGSASLVLTGGSIGIATLREVAACPARDAVEWAALDVWWGDERFLPGGHPDRNETQAREALLDAVALDPARVHPMPASDGALGEDLEAAAEAYAAALSGAAGAPGAQAGGAVPAFDVVLLGMGPDGHVNSLFPGMEEVHDARAVVGVRGAPKPPPTRVSLTLGSVARAREVWLLAAGQEKAAAVALALSGDAAPAQVPAAGARGRECTRWLLDRAAASRLPAEATPGSTARG